jgi:hypothetical protein
MKTRIIIYVIIAVALFGAAGALIRSCGYDAEAKLLAAEIGTTAKHTKAHAKALDKQIAEQAKIIGQMDKAIGLLRGAIGTKDGAIKDKDKEIVGLSDELARAKTDAERVPILTKLVDEWTQKFRISETKIKDYDGIIFSLNKKYESQVVISGSWKYKYDDMSKLNAENEALVGMLRRDLGVARIVGGVKSAAVVALGAYIIYSLIKK